MNTSKINKRRSVVFVNSGADLGVTNVGRYRIVRVNKAKAKAAFNGAHKAHNPPK